MRKILLSVLVVSLITVASTAFTADLTFDDFMPIVQAPSAQREGLREVKDRDAVTTETSEITTDGKTVTIETVSGKTLQDAANAFLKRREGGEKGAARLQVGDRTAYIATGTGIYDREMNNITAVRISQRLAYLQALMDAKVQLVALLNYVEASNTDIYGHENDNQATSENNSNGMSNAFDSVGQSKVADILKGYVTYDVYDDDAATVYVTIVATDKTIGKFSRPASDTIVAANMTDAMNAILAEIQSGVVPPVGGRIVDVPETGEMAFVGFGSAVVYPAQKKAAQAIQKRDAQKIAVIRAESELCGILTGNKVDGQAKYKESVRQAFGDYEGIENQDPMNELATNEDRAQVKAIKDGFMSNSEFQEAIVTASKGILPPGVTRRTWLDQDGVFAYAVAVYVPSFTNKTAADSKAMKEAQLLKPVEPEKSTTQPTKTAPAPQNEKPKETIKRGVTGTIQQNL